MKILFLSPNEGLLHDSLAGYGTGGWIGSLQSIIINSSLTDSFALAYPSTRGYSKIEKDGFEYYSIPKRRLSKVSKLLSYYGIINVSENYNKYINLIINDFQPDIIQIFGMENPFLNSVEDINVPIVVHLQGLLSPIVNAYFPSGFSKSSFLYPFTLREWIWHNGICHSYAQLIKKASNEQIGFQKFRYFIGRTNFDKIISSMFSPLSNYYKVNEVLRKSFYDESGTWNRPSRKISVFSTLSEATYKGIDTVLKTSSILKNNLKLDFVWRVAGISQNSTMVHLFEHHLGINSNDCNVEYVGIANERQLINYMKESHVFVHPSSIDNSPNSVCEAQILGMPVIACNVGGLSSIVENGYSGILVPSNSPYEMAYYIKEIVTNNEFADTLGRQAYQCAKKRHDRDAILNDLFSAYHKILKDYSLMK